MLNGRHSCLPKLLEVIVGGQFQNLTISCQYRLLLNLWLKAMFRPRFRGRGCSNALLTNPLRQDFTAFHPPFQQHLARPFFLINEGNQGFSYRSQIQGPAYTFFPDAPPLYYQQGSVQQRRFQQVHTGGDSEQLGQQHFNRQSRRSGTKRNLLTEDESDAKKSRSTDDVPPTSIQDVPVPPTDYSRNSLITQEIIQYFIENHQTEVAYSRKLHLRDALYTILQGVLPNCGLYITGSSMTGFSTTASDMDLCLMISDQEIDQRREAPEFLFLIRKALSKCTFLTNFEVIRAKVPILRVFDLIGKIEVDLNINSAVGVRNTFLLKYYSLADWRVRPLMLFIKKWARFHDINDARKRTLSSYSLSLMLIHYLQCGVSPPVLPVLQKMYPDVFSADRDIRDLRFDQDIDFKSENEQMLGDLFLGFLSYYANSFNYEEDCISVRLGLKTKAKTVIERSPTQYAKSTWHNYEIAIEEPFDLSNTARSFSDKFTADRVRRVIRVSYARLNTRRDVECLFQHPL